MGTGVGTSGIPGIPDREPPGVLVESEGKLVLFDCSEGIRFRIAKAGYEFTDVHHIAISHSHPDHNVFQPFLLAVHIRGQLSVRKGTIIVHGSRQLTKALLQDSRAKWGNFALPNVIPNIKVTFDAMKDGEIRTIGKNRLVSRKVYHQKGKIDARAFRLETPRGIFVYSGDTGWCKGIREIAREADVFVCEASARLGKEEYQGGWGHLSAFQAGEIAREAEVKLLVLSQYTGLDSDKKLVEACRKAGFKCEVIVGKDFQTFKLNPKPLFS